MSAWGAGLASPTPFLQPKRKRLRWGLQYRACFTVKLVAFAFIWPNFSAPKQIFFHIFHLPPPKNKKIKKRINQQAFLYFFLLQTGQCQSGCVFSVVAREKIMYKCNITCLTRVEKQQRKLTQDNQGGEDPENCKFSCERFSSNTAEMLVTFDGFIRVRCLPFTK